MVSFSRDFSRDFQRYWLLVLLAIVLPISLAACNPQGLRSSAAQVSQIVETQIGDPKTFNFALSNESPNVFGYIYEGLITENALTGELEPALAESWKLSDNKQQVEVTLREGLKWSDGQPLTVDDVVFSYQEIYLNPKIPTDIQDILRIGKQRKLPTVKKLDDRRVEFTTPEPFAPFLRNSTGLPVMPAHILRETVTQKDQQGNPLFLSTWGTGTDPKKIVCNGPYMLDQYVTSQRVVFKRNPYYWRKDAQGNQQPYIERVVWSLVENQNTSLLQFRSGGQDAIEPLRPEDFPLLKQEEKRGKFTLHVGGPRPGTTFISFNLNQGRRNGKPIVDPIKARWFNNVKFRQAVAYAIDRQKIVNNIYRGVGVLVNSPIISQSPYFLPPEKGLRVYNFEPDKARELLKAGGFTYNSQGQLLDAEGNRVRFTLMTNAENTFRVAITGQIKQDLAKLGMQVDLNPINFNLMIDKLDNTFDWDCYLILMGGGGRDPHSGTNVWSTEGSSHNFNPPSLPGKPPIEGRVIADWEAEISRLYIEGSQELDETKRKAIYAKTQQLSQEYLPWIPLANGLLLAAVRDRVQPIQYPELGDALWNLRELRTVD
ncbi:MAG: ABC transporter substrate-binding protein [Leptolyngbyaceae cyanobacterium CSU_1_3]|nr:ABC transporter substrate-binding protein [Leptolyngbyaceae cyanobacterium CSU_1_3]